MNTHSCTGLRQSHELNEVPAYFCNMQKPSKLWKAPMSRGTTDDILAACSSIFLSWSNSLNEFSENDLQTRPSMGE